jgi:hypothetical protein
MCQFLQVISYQDHIIAHVNQEIITSLEIENRVKLLALLNDIDSTKDQKDNIIQSMINEKLLCQIAQKNGVLIPEERIDNDVNIMINALGFNSIHAFCKKFKITKNSLFDYIKSQILLRELVKIYIEPYTHVSTKEVLDNLPIVSSRYFNHSLAIKVDRKFQFRQIVLYKRRATNADLQEVVLALKKGESFEKLVNQYSQQEGDGLISWVSETHLSKSVLDSFKLTFLNVGSISNIIKTDNSIIILKINAIKEMREDYVRNILYHRKISSNLKYFVKNLRKTSYIQIVQSNQD